MSEVSDQPVKRQYTKYDPEAVWRAVIEADGNLPKAARALGLGEHTQPGYLAVKMSAAAARLGIMLPRGAVSTPGDRVAMARALLGEGSVVLTSAGATFRSDIKVVSAPMLPATCHPDREEFQLRLCRSCYDARMRRSQAATAAGVVDRVPHRIERAPIEHRNSRSGPIMRTRVTLEGERVGMGAYAPEVVADQLAGEPGRYRFGIPLSAKEMEVMRLVAEGLINKAIAHQLAISEQTVKNHMSTILRKLGAQTRSEAVVKMGWVHMDGFNLDVQLHQAKAALAIIAEAHVTAARQVASIEAAMLGRGPEREALGPGSVAEADRSA